MKYSTLFITQCSFLVRQSYFTTDQTTPDVAETRCVGEGGHLASIHDAVTNNYLLTLTGPTDWVHIGGLYVNGEWTWTDGSLWDYEAWAPGQPTPRPVDGDYVEFHNREWSKREVDNYHTHGYICQKIPTQK